MRTLLRGLIPLASCGGAATPPTSSPTIAPTASATVAAATTVATASASVTAAAPTSVLAASECTSATATTRQVIERYFALSTSNDAQAVTDCFAKVWREKNATGVKCDSIRGRRRALVTLKKALAIVWGVWRSGRDFDPAAHSSS